MSGHMRTTIRLDDALLNRAKEEAAQRGMTFTQLVEEGLRLAIAGIDRKSSTQTASLPVCTAGGGLLPGVDLDDSDSVIDVLEGIR
jgi:hypothetical protein